MRCPPLVRPYGMLPLIAMACRIAMHPELHGLTHGSQADRAAAAHAKMLFESTHSPLDIPSRRQPVRTYTAIRIGDRERPQPPAAQSWLVQGAPCAERLCTRADQGSHVLAAHRTARPDEAVLDGGRERVRAGERYADQGGVRTEDPFADARKTACATAASSAPR